MFTAYLFSRELKKCLSVFPELKSEHPMRLNDITLSGTRNTLSCFLFSCVISMLFFFILQNIILSQIVCTLIYSRQLLYNLHTLTHTDYSRQREAIAICAVPPHSLHSL